MSIDTYTDINELPYEKCLRYGAQSLTDSELIAVLLRTGTRRNSCLEIADKVLLSFGKSGLLGFKHISISTLTQIDGIGMVKAIMLSCIGELSTRISRSEFKRKIIFSNSDDIASYYMESMRHLEKEHFIVMYLDTKCALIHESVVSVGTVNLTCVSPREIFLEALKYNAVNIIMLHNHPSGDPSPSSHDIATTRRIREAGELLGITLADHIIIGDNLYISLREKNLL